MKTMDNKTSGTNDPFSEVLKLARMQPMISGGFTAGGTWALRFPRPVGFKFFALVKGNCWLTIEDIPHSIRLEEGDVFLLAIPKPFTLASDLGVEPIDAVVLFADHSNRTASIGDSAECIQIGGHVKLDAASGGLLEHILPPFIHVRASSPRADSLKILLNQLVTEMSSNLPGEPLVSAHLAQLLFVHILRVYMDSDSSMPNGWLRAVCDPRLAPILQMMHGNPSHDWQLNELAKEAAMSRTSFATYFKSVVGLPPLTYLTEWRMLLAKRTLEEEDTPISVIAYMLGYSSESAFSSAFKRNTGLAPKHYRQEKTR